MSLTGAEKLDRMERSLLWGGPTHRISDMMELIKQGKAQIWERGDGVIVTEITAYPLVKVVNFWLIFGELHDCLALEDTIIAWALEHGCTVAIASGRRGWGRAAAPTGWRLRGYNFFKPLTLAAGPH